MSKLLKFQSVNFRNLSSDYIEFSPKINCLFGPNGNGKTNVLEAIYFLFNKKSFRKSATFSELISVDTESPYIQLSALLDNGDEKKTVSLKIGQDLTNWSVNGQLAKKGLDLKSVLISPFDAFNFFNESQFRRYFIDFHLSLIDSDYKQAIAKFQKLLKFRNRLLSKKPDLFNEQIKAIDPDLAKLSVEITKKRKKFVSELSEAIFLIYQKIFSEDFKMKLELVSEFAHFDTEQIIKALQEQRVKDEIIGHTTKGIHRDDYTVYINGLSAFDYASLGQQKMCYLGLLFAYIELFWYKFLVYPIILIDDISGELDMERWGRLVSYLEAGKFQVLITTANHHFKEKLESIEGIKKIEVNSGKIKNL